jgi:hypothetical protein
MIAFPRGEEILWSDLTPRALFGVSIRSETHLAVKIQCRPSVRDRRRQTRPRMN